MNKLNQNILIDVPIPIVTDRLILRPPMAGDGVALQEAKLETREQLYQWMIWAKEKDSVAESEITCREAYAKFIAREDMMMFAFDKATSKFIGSSGIHRFDWSVRRFELGYWVRKSEQGKGYATEIANALTRYAFGALNARAVMIGHADGNKASKHIIQKLGFEFEGTAKFTEELPNGDVVDSHSYSRVDTKGLPELQVTWGIEP